MLTSEHRFPGGNGAACDPLLLYPPIQFSSFARSVYVRPAAVLTSYRYSDPTVRGVMREPSAISGGFTGGITLRFPTVW